MKTFIKNLTELKTLIIKGLISLRKEGSFAQNYAFVFSGTGVNILVQLVVTPVITRLYGPEPYGVYSLFLSLSTNLALIASLRLPQAVILPKEELEFRALLRVGILSATTFSIIVFLVLMMYAEPILLFFKAEKISAFYYLIPVMTWLIAANQYFGAWQYRLNMFKKSTAIDTSVLVGVRGFNLVFGYVTNGMMMGLVYGDLIGKVSGLILSWRMILKNRIKELFARVTLTQAGSAIRSYRVYPLVNLPTVWLDLLSTQLPIYFLSTTFGLQAVGSLSLAIGMMDLPKRLLAFSLASLYYKKASDLYKESPNSLPDFVSKMFYILLALSVLPYAGVIVFGDSLFGLIFGTAWKLSGTLAQYIAISSVFEILLVPASHILLVLRKEKSLLVFQILQLVVKAGVLAVSWRLQLTIQDIILSLSMVSMVVSCMQLGYILRLLRLEWIRMLVVSVVSLGTLVVVLFGMKFLMSR